MSRYDSKGIAGKGPVVSAKPAPVPGRLVVAPPLEADGKDEQTVSKVVLVAPAAIKQVPGGPPLK